MQGMYLYCCRTGFIETKVFSCLIQTWAAALGMQDWGEATRFVPLLMYSYSLRLVSLALHTAQALLPLLISLDQIIWGNISASCAFGGPSHWGLRLGGSLTTQITKMTTLWKEKNKIIWPQKLSVCSSVELMEQSTLCVSLPASWNSLCC